MCEGIAMAPQIMVVDDEANVRELVCDALRIAEFETLQANDGMSALTLLRTTKPDLLIIDINMPLMDGFDLVERLRSQGDMTPVLMLSARSRYQEGPVLYWCLGINPSYMYQAEPSVW